MTCLLCTAEFILQEFYISFLSMKLRSQVSFHVTKFFKLKFLFSLKNSVYVLPFEVSAFDVEKFVHSTTIFLLVCYVKTLTTYRGQIVFWRMAVIRCVRVLFVTL